MDQKKLRQKILLNLASSPLTLVPALAGVSILLVLWTFSISALFMVVVGCLGLVAGIGSFLTRLFVGDSSAGTKAIADLRREHEQEQIDELDKLDHELRRDKDPRTQQMLRDLRALVRNFKDSSENLNTSSLLDITIGVEQLFEEGVKMLHKSLDFYRTALGISGKSTRETILQQREEVLKDVKKSIDQLGKLLTDIQKMDVEDHSQQEKIRQELRDSFEIAKRVREQMADLNGIRVIRSDEDKEKAYV